MCFLLYIFYGKNSSYVHGGLDSNGKQADAVYRQEEIHKKLMSQNFTNCHIKIYHVDAEATLNGGIVVQVMGTLSNNNQAEQSFMQTFVLAPHGSDGTKFYVYNDMFRYQDEVCCLVTEPQEESEKKLEKSDEKHQTPELEPDNSANLNDQKVSKDLQENLEKPDMKLEPKPEPLPDIKEDKPEPAPEKGASEDVQKSTSLAPGDVAPAQKDLKAVIWAEVVSKNLLPKGAVPVKHTLPHLVKVKPAQPIMLRGAYRLNVEEKKSQVAREGNLKNNCLQGPGGPCGVQSGGMGVSSEEGMVHKGRRITSPRR
ncbi:ras GTPase-activating protein-binding 1 [Sigmodon hispidus]